MAMQTYISELTLLDKKANRLLSRKMPKPTASDDPRSFFTSQLADAVSALLERAGIKLQRELPADIPHILWTEGCFSLSEDGGCQLSAVHKVLS